MAHRPHKWVNGELITAEKLNDLEQVAAQAAQPGPKGADGRSIYACSTDIGTDSPVKRSDITGGGDVATGDLIIAKNGEIYQVEEAGEDTVTVGDVISNLKGPAGDKGAGLTGTKVVLASLAADADTAAVIAKVNEIIGILNDRGVSKVS